MTLNVETSINDAVDPQAVEYLKQETEHYYKAELQHEQRANWLLVTAIALSGFVGNRSIEHWASLGSGVQMLFITGMFFLAISVIASIIAMWPLTGRRGRLASPASWQSLRQLDLPENATAVLVRHCEAHRLRAVVRARQVIWALIAFTLGFVTLVLGLAAII
jgi:hypothetical protein